MLYWSLFRSSPGANTPTVSNHLRSKVMPLARIGINAAVSPHWLRHAHGSHAIERGAAILMASPFEVAIKS